MKCEKIFFNILCIILLLLSLCEARGGRRGGSFGGLFGSWRRYKKPLSGGGSSRRIVSSSPVHTPITKALQENKKPIGSDKFQKNIKTNNYYNNYKTPLLPTGGSYYQNTAALPGNAIYVAQAPPRGAEIGDFLTGYLTGRLLTTGFSSPHYQITYVYRDNPPAPETDPKPNDSDPKVIIVNGQPQISTVTAPFSAELEKFTATESSDTKDVRSTSTEIPLSITENTTPPYGVICIPMLLSETNQNGEQVQIERTVCYPASAPLSPQKDLKSKSVEIAGDIIMS